MNLNLNFNLTSNKQPHQTKCGKIAMQRRGWWFPSPQEESAVWPSNRRGRDQGSRGERFCEPSLSSASSRWSLLRIRRNKITPMLVFWVGKKESYGNPHHTNRRERAWSKRHRCTSQVRVSQCLKTPLQERLSWVTNRRRGKEAVRQ